MNRKNRKVKVEDSPFYTKEELKQIKKNINDKKFMKEQSNIGNKTEDYECPINITDDFISKEKIPMRYLLVREIPKSLYDLHREHPWYTYGAVMDKTVELTKQQLEWLCLILDTTKCLVDCSNIKELIKKVLDVKKLYWEK